MVVTKTPRDFEGTGEPPRRRNRILIVSADSSRWQELRALLLAWGHSVEHAADSWQAIGKVKERYVDVAIISLDLPLFDNVALSAWDLERICRELNPGMATILIPSRLEEEVKASRVERLLRTVQQRSFQGDTSQERR